MRFNDEIGESAESKASAFVTLPEEMPGDLKVDVEASNETNSIPLHIQLDVNEDTTVSVVGSLSVDEAERLADKLQACAEEVQEESE